MRVASNKLKDIIHFYYAELSAVYEKEETEALVSLAVEFYLGYSRTEQLGKLESHVNQSELLKLYDCAKALKQNMPLQYILGEAWFYNLKFKVSPAVLIPRPETEELVDLLLKENKDAISLLDIGTGSGCIPVTVKKNLPDCGVSACDISTDALSMAQLNARLNNVDVRYFEADVLNTEAFSAKTSSGFEVIISNPPYIKHSEKASLSKNVIDHEPDLALFVSEDDNIIFYKKIMDSCRHALLTKGRLYFELNPLTAGEVQAYARQSGLFDSSQLMKDLSGKTRFFKATRG